MEHFLFKSELHEYKLSQNGFQTRGYSFRTMMPNNFRWDIPHVNFLFREFKIKLKSRFPLLKFKKIKAILELSHDLDYIKKNSVLILKQTLFNGFNLSKIPV